MRTAFQVCIVFRLARRCNKHKQIYTHTDIRVKIEISSIGCSPHHVDFEKTWVFLAPTLTGDFSETSIGFYDHIILFCHIRFTDVTFGQYLKQDSHWGDSEFDRTQLVSTDRLVLNGLQCSLFYNCKNIAKLKHKGFDFKKYNHRTIKRIKI